jgi:hypothetical protein
MYFIDGGGLYQMFYNKYLQIFIFAVTMYEIHRIIINIIIIIIIVTAVRKYNFRTVYEL